MSRALAADAVRVRQGRARGVSEAVLRRQLAQTVTPRLRRYVFVRCLTLRAAPTQIGRAMEAALTRLADESASEILCFADFAAVVVACARAALGGGLGHGWHWPMLGLPRMAGPGEAVGSLLAAYPLEAGSAVAALSRHGLLEAVWRDFSDPVAVRVTQAVAWAAGVAIPAFLASEVGKSDGEFRRRHDTPPLSHPASVLLARSAEFWANALRPMSPSAEAVRTAALLSALRWAPGVLRTSDEVIWRALLRGIASIPPAATPEVCGMPGDGSVPESQASSQIAAHETPSAFAAVAATAPAEPVASHGDAIATGWGGVLFLINALNRLDIEALAGAEAPAPTGWRLLRDLGVALGLPEDEPLEGYLAQQDLDTQTPAPILVTLLTGLEDLYRPRGPWPLPLAQPGVLHATETHLDLDLGVAGIDIDIAVRLAGLDLNPGWVPWLGRVVAFHYDALPVHVRRD